MTPLKALYKFSELAELMNVDRETLESLVEANGINKVRIARSEGTKGHWAVPLASLLQIPGIEASLDWIRLANRGLSEQVERDDLGDVAELIEELHGRIDRLHERMNRAGIR